MSNAIKWQEEYSVNIEEIDNQHKKFTHLVSKVLNSINKQKFSTVKSKTIEELIDYADYHFETEEKYFKDFNYENANEHILEHHNFKTKILELQKKHLTDEVTACFELIDFLEDWLIIHISESDQKYVKCFKSNGLK